MDGSKIHLPRTVVGYCNRLTKYQRHLVVVLAVSFILRFWLIMCGGQVYFTDENRYYYASRTAVDSALAGDLFWSIRVLHSAEQFAFKVIGVIPALLESTVGYNPKVPALFFSIFSVLNLYLLWKLARNLGSSPKEAIIATTLLASSTTFFYYCRHLFPYDLSMSFALIALIIAFNRPVRFRDSCLCGVFSSAAFLTYNGYWLLGAFALLAHTFYPSRIPREIIRRAAVSGVFLFLPIVIPILISRFFGGNMLQHFIEFSKTVTQGSFSEGWSLPFEYLWHADHFLLPIYSVAVVFCLWQAVIRQLPEHVGIGVAGFCFVYGVLVLFSVGFEKFVVYGRLVRQCMPFLCILTAHLLIRLGQDNILGKKALTVLCIFILSQAAVNFSGPLTITFPNEFIEKAESITLGFDRRQYDLLFVKNIYPAPNPVPTRAHQVILKKAHPLEYLPYQYEGYTPSQREKLRSTDISMRLIKYSTD